eukprot:2756438-Alexandrium_andersonii.AAC.1
MAADRRPRQLAQAGRWRPPPGAWCAARGRKTATQARQRPARPAKGRALTPAPRPLPRRRARLRQ